MLSKKIFQAEGKKRNFKHKDAFRDGEVEIDWEPRKSQNKGTSRFMIDLR